MGIAFNANQSIQKTAEVYAVIDGIPIALPKDAKFVCQDKRGCWYYCARRPRIKGGDWTPNKTPIQVKNVKGHTRVLQTDVKMPWEHTLQSAVKRAHLPVF